MPDAAKREWRAALAAWPDGAGQPPHQLAERAILLARTGDKAGGGAGRAGGSPRSAIATRLT